MKYFKVKYTIYNVDGTIKFKSVICKVWEKTLKRMRYLTNMYGSLVKFEKN